MAKQMQKSLLLFGASGGIGEAIYEQFSDDCWDITAPRSTEVDLTSSNSISKFLKVLNHSFDAVIFAAGKNEIKTFDLVTTDELSESFALNIAHPFFIIQSLIAQNKIRTPASITFLSSLYGRMGRSGRLPYTVSKHGLEGLVKSLAIELGKYDIRVNSITPGFVDTKMTRRNLRYHEIEDVKKKSPLSKLVAPRDVAQATYYISHQNQSMTGQSLVIDAGIIAGGLWNE